MNQEKVNHVYRTNDLSIFKFTKFNRNVAIRKEMLDQAKEGFLAPIIVNENMIVIDGQHRVEHAKMAGASVTYIIIPGLDEKDIVRMNTTQKPWNLLNYIESFANQGIESYVTLLELKNKNKIGISELVSIADDKSHHNVGQRERVKNGNFQFFNLNKTISFLNYYKRFKEETNSKNQSKLALAVYELYRIKNFDKERLIQKVIQLDFNQDINEKNYKDNSLLMKLIDVYNHKITPKSQSYIHYNITQLKDLKILNEYHDWTTKKTTREGLSEDE